MTVSARPGLCADPPHCPGRVLSGNVDQTIAAFAARLKDAVDLDSVRDDLAGVVNHALEPAQVSVWISQRDWPTSRRSATCQAYTAREATSRSVFTSPAASPTPRQPPAQ
jgi:hypothetical protein